MDRCFGAKGEFQMRKEIFFSLFALSAATASAATLPAEEIFPVEFISITAHTVIHRSYAMISGNKTASNGLILLTDRSAVIIDTAWNDEETNQIIEYVHVKLKKEVSACIITHFHQDRAGGIGTMAKRSIPVYMTDQTHRLLEPNSQKYPYERSINGLLRFDGITPDLEYFGPAHSPDNIIVYDERDKVFFGGCLIKSMDSQSIGNTADADLRSWPKVLKRIRGKYPDARIIIPGHGDAGDLTLLDHTLRLLE